MSKPSRKKDVLWEIKYKGMTKEALKLSFCESREYGISKDEYSATINDNFWAAAMAVRDRVVERWIATSRVIIKRTASGCIISRWSF